MTDTGDNNANCGLVSFYTNRYLVCLLVSNKMEMIE